MHVERVVRGPDRARGRDIALLEARVVAVPVQVHADSLALVPDRGEVDRADRVVGLHVEPGALLQGIERVHPPWPVRGPAVEPREVTVELVERVLHLRNDHIAVEHPLRPGEPPGETTFDRGEHRVGVEPLVAPDLPQEVDVVPDPHPVGRHAEDDVLRRSRLVAVGAHVADRAVEPDEPDRLVAVRRADRRHVAFLVDESDLLPALARGFSAGGRERPRAERPRSRRARPGAVRCRRIRTCTARRCWSRRRGRSSSGRRKPRPRRRPAARPGWRV